ncbi:MAG TPA: hypothetical protein VMC62_10900 [Longilinea sp.]|nr:hypothetical protein [Longilinea sp.]
MEFSLQSTMLVGGHGTEVPVYRLYTPLPSICDPHLIVLHF